MSDLPPPPTDPDPPVYAESSAYPGPPKDTATEVVATVIPFRNKPALIAYYLGVFSISALIPFFGVVGVVMALAAFILGIKGRKLAKENPEAKGIVHAWIGIIGGFLWGALGTLVQGLMVIALMQP